MKILVWVLSTIIALEVSLIFNFYDPPTILAAFATSFVIVALTDKL